MPPLKDIKFVPDIIIKPKPLIYNWTVKHQDKVDRVDRPDKIDNVSVKYIYFVTKDDEKRTGHGRVQYGTSYFKSSKHFHLPSYYVLQQGRTKWSNPRLALYTVNI